MRRRSAIILLVLVILVGLSANALMAQPVLHMLSALDPNEYTIYNQAFEAATGIKIEAVKMSAGECQARLMAEAKNPQFSIWFGGSSPEFAKGAQAGLIEPFKPQGADFIKANQRDKDWNWVGFYFGAIAFGSNKDWFAKNNQAFPTSWQDLLKPAFKGQISFAYPYSSGTAYTIMATALQLMGEEKGFDYLKKLDANVHHYNTSGPACVTQAGLGEIAISIAFTHDIMAKGISQGYPLKMTVPSEGTGYEIGAMAVVKGGPEPDLAKQYINWALTTDCQNLMQKWFRVPLNPKAKVAEGAVSPDEIKLIDYDAVWAGANYQRLIEKWKTLTGK